MNVTVNVTRILQAMEARQLKIVDVCAVCGVNNKTLAKILRGEVPRRIDAFYRVVNGLQIPFQEAVIAPTHKTTQGSRLYVLRGRRRSDQIA
jgi:transcriptional regulator with XRE-family HTH domain